MQKPKLIRKQILYRNNYGEYACIHTHVCVRKRERETLQYVMSGITGCLTISIKSMLPTCMCVGEQTNYLNKFLLKRNNYNTNLVGINN